MRWGTWWVWGDEQLVLFLVLFLFYCAYFMLRFSVDPGPQRANLRGLRTLRRRADPDQLPRDPAREQLHPPHRLHEQRAPDGHSQLATFCVAWAAMLSLAYIFYRFELAGKRLAPDVRELRELLA